MRAIEKTAESAKKHGKASGIITGNAAYIRKAKASGMTMFSKGSELSLLAEGLRKTVSEIRE